MASLVMAAGLLWAATCFATPPNHSPAEMLEDDIDTDSQVEALSYIESKLGNALDEERRMSSDMWIHEDASNTAETPKWDADVSKGKKVKKLQHTDAKPAAGRVSICAMAKNEGRYITEWLNFHKCAGIDHFYILNDHSTDDTGKILQWYVKKGWVTLIDRDELPEDRPQKAFNANCMDRAKLNRDRWTAFIDLDEFLYPIKGDSIETVLRKYNSFAQISIPWTTYGTSGFQHPTDSFLTKTHVLRNHIQDRIYKSIVNPSKVVSDFESALNHEWRTPSGEAIFRQGELVHGFSTTGAHGTEDGKKFGFDDCCYFYNEKHKPTSNALRLNHYRFKSVQEAEEKLSRTNANSNGNGMSKFQKWGRPWTDWDLNNHYDDTAFNLYGECLIERAKEIIPGITDKNYGLDREDPQEDKEEDMNLDKDNTDAVDNGENNGDNDAGAPTDDMLADTNTLERDIPEEKNPIPGLSRYLEEQVVLEEIFD